MKYLLHDILKWSFSERKETGGMDVKIQRNQRMLAAFGMLGFAVGIVYANLMTRDYIGNIGIFNDFFLQQYGMVEIDMPDYLWYLGRIRILPVVLLAMLGYTRFRRVVVSAFLLWTGFSCGMIMTASVLQMGIRRVDLVFDWDDAAYDFLYCGISDSHLVSLYLPGYALERTKNG